MGWNNDVKFQILLIFVLVSLISWGGFFFAARHGYHTAQDVGLIPNLHIKQRLGLGSQDTAAQDTITSGRNS